MAGFEIDGERYEVPILSELTIAECETLYELTRDPETRRGIIQEDFEPADPTWDEAKKREHADEIAAKFRRPDFRMAMATIAYRRRHPDTELAEARSLAGGASNIAFTVALILGGDDVDPTRRSYASSRRRHGSESGALALLELEDSGSNSERSGTEPDTLPGTTGTSG